MSTQVAADVEEANCPMCGADARIAVYGFDPFGVVRCGVCRFFYLSPRLPEPAMLELYRSGEYFEGGEMGYDSYAEQESALRATYRRLVRQLVRAGLAGGDLLEVGCGYGFLLEEAQSAFRTCVGTEFSEQAAESARARGLDVLTGGIEQLPPAARFDCVLSAHVVEHVYDPKTFVAGLRSLLRPGGTLILGTPDTGSVWRRSMGARWPSFKIPEHVMYFDRRSLTRLLSDAGLEEVRPFPFLHAFPLSLIARKVGLGFLGRHIGGLGRLPVWLPATTLAVSGRKPRQLPR
jgi:SAM-dependent methyltransferase